MDDWVLAFRSNNGGDMNVVTYEFGSIEYWNTSEVTDMRGMFIYATYFNEDIGGWDTSIVTDMRDMFDGATSFNQDLSGWDVDNVTNNLGYASNADAWLKPLPNSEDTDSSFSIYL